MLIFNVVITCATQMLTKENRLNCYLGIKMKRYTKHILLIFLIFETICIGVLTFIPFKIKADEWSSPIDVPAGMKLTIIEDVEFTVNYVFVDEWNYYVPEKTDYFVPGGTVSTPTSITYNKVNFLYEDSPDIGYNVDYENIKEIDQLLDLKKEAERKTFIVQTGYIAQGISLIFNICTIWFIAVGLMTQLFLKNNKIILITLLHTIALIVAALFLLVYMPWLF